MRRVREQCGAQRSTEAIAQPAARRPEAQRRDTPKSEIICLLKNFYQCKKFVYISHLASLFCIYQKI
ncbi:MAG: hypothetical protein NZ455_11900 [Bacteroidia bacterium]|nr:hypothetical protein [Bacteroidia bacterium]MDW8348089.1 hypothetical protein [Bacteroidia bacterium]